MKFKSKYSDIEIEFYESGWADIKQKQDKINISLGKYPNRRWELLEKALKYAKDKNSTRKMNKCNLNKIMIELGYIIGNKISKEDYKKIENFLDKQKGTDGGNENGNV